MRTSDLTLQKIGDNKFCPYLLSQTMLTAIAETLKEDESIKEIFGNSIMPYNRDDFTTRELPAISFFLTRSMVTSRNSYENGNLTFKVYLPITIARNPAMVSLTTIPRYIANVMQAPWFIYSVRDKLIPLPDVNSNNYNDIVEYKAKRLSPLLDIFARFNIVMPKFVSDTWRADIYTNYTIDMQNWMWFLENIGIDYVNPNKIVYPYIDTWRIYTNIQEE